MKIVNLFVGSALCIFSCRFTTFGAAFTLGSSKEFIRYTKSHVEYQEEAKINVKRIKRFDSTDSIKHDPYSITITAFDTEYHANVEKPRRSIFAPNFKFQTLGEDTESNTIVLRDATLTEKDIKEIEDRYYINSEKQASFSVRSLGDGGIRKVRGIIEDVAVLDNEFNSTGDDVLATKSFFKNTENSTQLSIKDFLDPGPRPFKLGRSLNLNNLKAECEPELYIVYDHTIFKKFHGNIRDITDYTGILFHAVNNRFATITDVKITFLISGVKAITSPGAQAFMEQNKIPDKSGYDISSTLQKFSESIYQNLASLPKHDLAIFISGADLQMKDEKGAYEKSTTGLAWLKGACFLNHGARASMGTSVAEDNGLYAGLYTITHELAHNLGSDHDGGGSSSDCDWKDGYIMSYVGYGTKNKFRFSKCSVRSMKKLVMSNYGDCLRTFEHKNEFVAISTKNIGQKVSMKAMCQTLMKNKEAEVDDKDASTLCKNIYCKVVNTTTLADGSKKIATNKYQSNIPAGDDTPCGNGGRCWDGECVQKIARKLDAE